MQEFHNQAETYEVTFAGGEYNSYFFKTENEIIYEIKFKDFFYLFGETAYSYHTYEFAIEVADKPFQGRPPLDTKIPITVASIFIDFFEKIGEPVVIYICDTSDENN